METYKKENTKNERRPRLWSVAHQRPLTEQKGKTDSRAGKADWLTVLWGMEYF